MGKYFVDFTKTARKDLQKHYQSGSRSSLKKIEKILSELVEHPYTGTGKPEQLKYSLQGFWSRRINSKDRLVYKVQEDIVTVFIVSAMGHYKDR